MAMMVIQAGRAFTPQEEIADAAIVIEDGKIARIGRRDEIQVPADAKEILARDMTVIPGFVDIHVHGAGGHDVMSSTEEALSTVAKAVARHGTTSLVATTVTAPPDETRRCLEDIARYIASPANIATPTVPTAEIAGIHLEGPFISATRRGVHPAGAIAKPSIALLDRYLEAAGGTARILTLAPEIPGALELVEHAYARGVVVALGHTDATYEQAHTAIFRGARHAVHVFNAMRPFSHRETGVIGAVLTDDSVTAEIIADGVHVDDPAIRLLLAAKGPELVILVSDGTAATGMRDGSYRLGTFDVTVSGGVCRNREGKLAGSTLTLDRALQHMVRLGVPLIEAVRMATLNPARRVGIAERKGVLAAGADADMVFLTPELKVANVYTRGVALL
ncbi:MAG TPA: N-acetylglucosamine-6-phosphate deacetylase [Candidatus Limnocylindrales bacterium]|nr:N-acetylglucosamine-6-phosphate deacetylase [Candidatus Limnocylindrales bacterium]